MAYVVGKEKCRNCGHKAVGVLEVALPVADVYFGLECSKCHKMAVTLVLQPIERQSSKDS